MQTVTARERERYEEVWNAVTEYGQNSPGEGLVELFLPLIGEAPQTILDAGCGSGKAGVALAARGHRVTLCDLTDAGLTPEAQALPFHEACLWQPLRPVLRQGQFDWVLCCDVLEHIPTALTMLVVDQLLRLTTRGLLLSVSLVADVYGAWVGQTLHHTVQSFTWWRDLLAEVGEVVEARDLITDAVFVMRPRR